MYTMSVVIKDCVKSRELGALYVQRPTLFHRLMGAMKTTASRETLASDHSDPGADAAAGGGGTAAINGRSISPSAAAYQRRREHSPSPCRSPIIIVL